MLFLDLVLLDLGNTLYYDKDPWRPILDQAELALWPALRQAGVSIDPREIYGPYRTLLELYNSEHRKDLSEPTTARVLKDHLEGVGVRVSDETIAAALRAMHAVTQANWYLEPDAIGLLDELKARDFQIGVISNAADEENTQRLIDKGGIRPYLGFIASSAGFGRRKPDPGIFRAALDHFGIPAERALMVGDTYEADIVGAKALGLQTIWYRGRAPDGPEPPHPEADAVIRYLSHIPAMISHGPAANPAERAER